MPDTLQWCNKYAVLLLFMSDIELGNLHSDYFLSREADTVIFILLVKIWDQVDEIIYSKSQNDDIN